MASTTTDRLNGVRSGTAVKAACRVATTENITLSGLQTIDGVALAADDRVLVKDQTSAAENGIYSASTGAWSRALDFDGNRDVVKGTRVLAFAGDDQFTTEYVVTTSDPITIGTSELVFAEVGELTAIAINSRRYIDVSNYVPADDSEDAADGIEAALAEGEGREVVFTHPTGSTRTYLIGDRADAAFTLPNNSRIIIPHGATIDFSGIGASGTRKTFFKGTGSLGSDKLLASDASVGDTQLELVSGAAADLAFGDELYLRSNKLFIAAGGSAVQGEAVTVWSVSGDTVTLFAPLQDSYTTANSARVALISPWVGRLEGGGTIIGPGRWSPDTVAETSGDTGFEFQMAKVAIDEISLQRCDYNALSLDRVMDSLVQRVRIVHDPAGSNTAVQYGIVHAAASRALTVAHCTIDGGKHGIVSVGGQGVGRGAKYLFNTIRGTWAGAIATHDEEEDLLVEGNNILGCNSGIDIRVRRVRTINNYIRDLPNANTGVAITLNNTTEDFTSDSDYVEGGRYAIRMPSTDTQIPESRGPEKINVRGMIADGQTQQGIGIVYDDTLTVTGAADNGSGEVRITVASTARLRTGDTMIVASVGGATGANGTHTITVVSSTTFDLDDSTFGGTYTSGGTAALVRSELNLENITVRGCGGTPIYVEGYFKRAKIKHAKLERSAAGACLQTAGTITDTHIEDVTYGPIATAPVLISTRLFAKNVRRWEITAPIEMTINASGTLGTIIHDFITVAANSGTSDDLDNITALAVGTVRVLQAASGDTITVRNNGGGSGNIRTADGANLTLTGSTAIKLIYDGTNWSEIGRPADDVFGRAEVTVGSAATTDIGDAASEKVAITGTASISSFGSEVNRVRFVRHTGAATLVHSVALFLPNNGSDIVTADGDTYLAISNSVGTWKVYDYQRANGKPLTPPAASDITGTIKEAIPGFIELPDEKDYTFGLNLPFGLTITKVTTICESGTCTATFKIGSTALGGTANSVSTSQDEQAHASNNVAAAGDDLVVTISSNSACVGLSFMVEATRALS